MEFRRTDFAFWRTQRLPVILQTEAAECGLACLAMVAGFHGHRIDLPHMRRRFPVSLKGVTLKSLITIARGLQLQTRPLKLPLQHIGDLKLPCVLHWDMNHFVVLKAVKAGHAILHDPAVGERRLSLEQLGKHFTGVALEASPDAQFTKREERQQFSLQSLMGRASGLRIGLLQLLLLGLALQVCALAAPFYLQWVIDEAVVSADRDLVPVLGIGFLLLVLVQSALSGVRSWITTVLATNLNSQWLAHAFGHLMKLPQAWFERRHLGDIVSRFSSIQTIQRSLTTQFVEGVIDGVLVLGTLVVMGLYSPRLTAVAGAAVLLYALLRWALFRSMREATAEQIIHAARQQSHFIESARGVQSLRLFNRIDERRIGYMNALTDQFNADLRIARLSVSYQTANTLLFGGERVIVVWLAALAVLDTRFSVGMLFAFISYKDQFTQRTATLIDKLFELRMLHLHGERVADIVLTPPEDESPDVEVDLGHMEPEIELKGLSFRHADGEPWVLEDVSLKVPSGQCLAITGASGCGKTTLVKLILGLLEPTAGEVLVGGIKLKQLGLRNFREMVATVMQDDQLFAGSIADNIGLFDPSPDLEHIKTCARLASIHDEVDAMPMRYHTLVGDIGSGLSGGQRQRLLLARALYKNPKILVLDEATSHLDVWNEQQVNASIRQLALTRIVVAHRPETIAMAQRVVVLQHGRIVRDFEQPTGEATGSALQQTRFATAASLLVESVKHVTQLAQDTPAKYRAPIADTLAEAFQLLAILPTAVEMPEAVAEPNGAISYSWDRDAAFLSLAVNGSGQVQVSHIFNGIEGVARIQLTNPLSPQLLQLLTSFRVLHA